MAIQNNSAKKIAQIVSTNIPPPSPPVHAIIVIIIIIVIAVITDLAPVLNPQGNICLYYIILGRNVCALLISLDNSSASPDFNPVMWGLCLPGWYWHTRYRYYNFNSRSVAPIDNHSILSEYCKFLRTLSLLKFWGHFLGGGDRIVGAGHRWELPGNRPGFIVVMVIYRYIERMWIIIVNPNFLYKILDNENILSRWTS